MKLILATKNKGKIREIKEILKGTGVEILSLEDFPSLTPPEEDGKSFEENALKKARSAAQLTGIAALSDDSGLIVDALDGMPGVFSARYAGGRTNDKKNYAKLLKELEGVPIKKRTARFVCVAAFVTPEGEEKTFKGGLEGVIAEKPEGSFGFGYDPVFWVSGFQKHGKILAALTTEEKNKISHRGVALKKFKKWLMAKGLVKKPCAC